MHQILVPNVIGGKTEIVWQDIDAIIVIKRLVLGTASLAEMH